MPRQIALHLALQRAEKGLTQADIAAQVGVDSAAVSAWENGHRTPTLGNLLAWCAALGLGLAVVPQDPTRQGGGITVMDGSDELDARIRELMAERSRTGRARASPAGATTEELLTRLIHTIHQAFKTPPDDRDRGKC